MLYFLATILLVVSVGAKPTYISSPCGGGSFGVGSFGGGGFGVGSSPCQRAQIPPAVPVLPVLPAVPIIPAAPAVPALPPPSLCQLNPKICRPQVPCTQSNCGSSSGFINGNGGLYGGLNGGLTGGLYGGQTEFQYASQAGGQTGGLYGGQSGGLYGGQTGGLYGGQTGGLYGGQTGGLIGGTGHYGGSNGFIDASQFDVQQFDTQYSSGCSGCSNPISQYFTDYSYGIPSNSFIQSRIARKTTKSLEDKKEEKQE